MKYTIHKLRAIGRLHNYKRSRGIFVDNGLLFLLQLIEALMLEFKVRGLKPERLGDVEALDKTLKRDKLLKRRRE